MIDEFDVEYVDYDIAVELRLAGFRWDCNRYYEMDRPKLGLQIGEDSEWLGSYTSPINWNAMNCLPWNKAPRIPVAAPLYQQVYEYFRHEHSLHVAFLVCEQRNDTAVPSHTGYYCEIFCVKPNVMSLYQSPIFDEYDGELQNHAIRQLMRFGLIIPIQKKILEV